MWVVLVLCVLVAFVYLDTRKPPGYPPGVVFTDGPLWREQRRFSLRQLRDLGLGRTAMEEQLRREAREMVARLRACSDTGEPVLMHDAFDASVLNALWALLAGRRFNLDDERLRGLLDSVHASFRVLDMSGGLLNQMPFLRWLAPERSGYSHLVRVLCRMWDFLGETVSEHRSSLSLDYSRDLIDSFLQEMERTKSQPNCTFTEEQLLSLCLDLFMAGSETTSNTLGFAALYMVLHPGVQARAQAELDAVVGRGDQPALHHRPRLCYVEAVLMEVQRHSGVVPVAVAHRALKTTELMGHTIPEGTTLLVSLHSIHMDRDHWGDPEIFRPERFISADNELVQDDWFMPFGLGKRRCLGEALARTSLFVFFTTLLHNFTLSQPPGLPPPSTQGYDGVTISPRPFAALLTPRN
ncbi:methyl farnesoate epoxidase-like isoform X2 [Bacillus rossius redtenbacheri]|uniref:methyl farnesoate epoxidase-like isoform X2 n=1 Tax=Bacillus rossius redtenbacheri TaxID=93214 RepID=UPI002FDCC6D6